MRMPNNYVMSLSEAEPQAVLCALYCDGDEFSLTYEATKEQLSCSPVKGKAILLARKKMKSFIDASDYEPVETLEGVLIPPCVADAMRTELSYPEIEKIELDSRYLSHIGFIAHLQTVPNLLI